MQLRRFVVGPALALALVAVSGARVAAAVPHGAVTEIQFVDGCSGQGYWFTWDAVLSPDPTEAPGWGEANGFTPIAWGPDQPITDPDGGPSILEEGRYAFLLIGSDRETRLFQAFYGTQGDSPLGDFVLRVTLDCKTTPYQVVAAPDTSAPPPSSPPTYALGWFLVATSAAALVRLTYQRRKG